VKYGPGINIITYFTAFYISWKALRYLAKN